MPDDQDKQENPLAIKTIATAYIHPKIDYEHLNPNGMLFTDAQIKAIQNNIVIQNAKDRVKKADLNKIFKAEIAANILTEFKFSLQRTGDDYLAIYKGQPPYSLGSGSFGAVKITQNLSNGSTSYALKIIKDADVTHDEIEREKSALQKTNQLKSLHKRPDKIKQYEFVIEMARGVPLDELFDKTMPTVTWIDMAINILKAVKDLHDKGILHCDLKPGNIHYDVITRKATIVDLGSASFISAPDNIKDGVSTTIKGTPTYMSAMAQEGTYNEKTELYALAIILAELFDLEEIEEKFFKPLGRNVTMLSIKKPDSTFAASTRITDENTRNALLALLHAMVADNTPLSLQTENSENNVITTFENIREKYIDALGLKKNVSYLNIADVLEAGISDLATMLKNLDNADEIWLVDDSGNNKDKYLIVRQRLINLGLNVDNVVIQYQGENLDTVMKAYSEQRETRDRNIYDCSYVLKSGELVQLEPVLHELHVAKIIRSLEEESKKLSEKYQNDAGKRVELISNTITKIQDLNKKSPLSLVQALRELDHLQAKILSEPETQNNIKKLMRMLSIVSQGSIKPLPPSAIKGFNAVKKHRVTFQETGENLAPTSVSPKRSTPPSAPFFENRAVPPPPPALMKRPPPLPPMSQAEIEARKRPEYQEWLKTRPLQLKYRDVVISTINGVVNEHQHMKFKQFANDASFHSANFYLTLLASATTVFQKALLVQSLLRNTDAKYAHLRNKITKAFAEDETFAADKDKLFDTLRNLAPKRVDSFLASLARIASSSDPFQFQDKVLEDLKKVDPTPDNISQTSAPKRKSQNF